MLRYCLTEENFKERASKAAYRQTVSTEAGTGQLPVILQKAK